MARRRTSIIAGIWIPAFVTAIKLPENKAEMIRLEIEELKFVRDSPENGV